MNNKKKFILTILIALALNIIWELSHYQLYFDLSGIPKYPHLLLASLTDMLIITSILLIISLKNKNISWIKKPNNLDYLIITTISMLIAIFIELRALRIERWAYKEIMPTIFGVGLSPLIQLPITTILSLILIKFLKK
jgi:hypothetical protein